MVVKHCAVRPRVYSLVYGGQACTTFTKGLYRDYRPSGLTRPSALNGGQVRYGTSV